MGATVTPRAVVFDIGGVLEQVDDDAWPELWVRRWESRMGLAAGVFEAGLARHSPSGSMLLGEVSEAQTRAMYAAALGLSEEQANAMMAEMWDAYCGELDVALRDFAASLRPSYKTAILSNSADGARREEQRRYGFEDLVDEIVYSHEVGLAKPDARIYRLTEQRLGVQPEEVVFVDDVLTNVEAARELGWTAVHHVDTAETIAEVTRILGR
ncbi:MAG TPA: HAD family phosphatase [Nocardioidaceae bacterium]|jgi:putative hydrolase of the HAD superfamily|nr:HAD family phosphatase [Nocardioidaceae bacterium]